MTLQLKPEQERVVDQAIQAGLIEVADEVLEVGVQVVRRRLAARGQSPGTFTAEQWSHELHTWVQTHSTATPLLSDEAVSRDSIYGTRGM